MSILLSFTISYSELSETNRYFTASVFNFAYAIRKVQENQEEL
jgi:hypothetical protein